MQQRVVTAGFIWKNGRFLVTKRVENDTYMPGLWEIPGGKLEIWEDPEDGLRRELLEETGLKVKIISPLSVVTNEKSGPDIQYVLINFLCVTDGSDVKLSSEHSDFEWITFDELDKFEMNPKMKQTVSNIKNHKLLLGFIEEATS